MKRGVGDHKKPPKIHTRGGKLKAFAMAFTVSQPKHHQISGYRQGQAKFLSLPKTNQKILSLKKNRQQEIN